MPRHLAIDPGVVIGLGSVAEPIRGLVANLGFEVRRVFRRGSRPSTRLWGGRQTSEHLQDLPLRTSNLRVGFQGIG